MDRIARYGVVPPTAWPLRRRAMGRLGAAGFWAIAAVTFFAATALLLTVAGAHPALYAAFAFAAAGLFLCGWGSIYGVELLLGQLERLEERLEAPAESIRREFLDRLRAWTAPSRVAWCAGLFAGGITGSLLLLNLRHAGNGFAEAFAATLGALYVPVFLAAASIGVGHACIAGAVAVAAALPRFTLRRTYLPAPIRGLSLVYLALATMALAAYVSFLAFLVASAAGGLALTPVLNAWAVGVGAVVLVVYLYPQWKIHQVLARNRAVLVAEAVAQVESLRGQEAVLTHEECERILRALDYVRAMEEFPTVGFRWKELAGVLIGYILPIVGFLLSQAPLFEHLWR